MVCMSKRAIITTPFPSPEETARTMGVPRSEVEWLVALAERLIPAGDISPSGSRDNGTHKGNRAVKHHSTRNGRK